MTEAVRAPRRVMRYRAPIGFKFLILVVGLVLLLVAWPAFTDFGRWIEVAQAAPLSLGPLIILWFNNAGYRIGYDDRAIYSRPSGVTWALRWPAWHRVAWDEIDRLEGRSHDKAPSFTPLLPWQYLAVIPTGEPDVKREVRIYPQILSESDLAEILSALVMYRADLVPTEIVEPLHKLGSLPASV